VAPENKFAKLELRSPPVLTQDSQGPQMVAPDRAVTTGSGPCISQLTNNRSNRLAVEEEIRE